MFKLTRPAAGVVFAGLVTCFAILLGSFADLANAKDPTRSSRAYLPDLPKLFKEGQKAKENKGFVTRQGVFRVKLIGYQMGRWNIYSQSDGVCTGSTEGGGFERVAFRSPAKRMVLSAFGKRRLTSMILPRLKVRGQLTRQGTYKHTPLENPSPDCPYGDGGGGPDYVPPAPDCGTRKFRGIPMSLFALDGFFTLRSEGDYEQRPKFRNCPSPRVQWPSIIDERTNGKPIQTRFPGRLVFNRKFDRKTGAWSKVIVRAKGIKRQRSLSSSSKTTLDWTLTLKRLR